MTRAEAHSKPWLRTRASLALSVFGQERLKAWQAAEIGLADMPAGPGASETSSLAYCCALGCAAGAHLQSWLKTRVRRGMSAWGLCAWGCCHTESGTAVSACTAAAAGACSLARGAWKEALKRCSRSCCSCFGSCRGRSACTAGAAHSTRCLITRSRDAGLPQTPARVLGWQCLRAPHPAGTTSHGPATASRLELTGGGWRPSDSILEHRGPGAPCGAWTGWRCSSASLNSKPSSAPALTGTPC